MSKYDVDSVISKAASLHAISANMASRGAAHRANSVQMHVVRRFRLVSGLVAALLVHERAHRGHQGPRHRLVVTTLLVGGEGLGLHSPCGCLVSTSFVGLRCQHCLVATALLGKCKGLRSLCGCLMTTSVVGLYCQHCRPDELGYISSQQGHAPGKLGRLLLCCGNCSPLTLFCSEGVLIALFFGECGPPACFLGLSVPRSSLIGNGLCSRGSRLSMLLLRLQCTCAAFLLMLHAGKCGLMLQLLRGLASEPGKEAMAAEP